MSAHLPYDLTRITRWSVPLTWVLVAINGWYFLDSVDEVALGISALNGDLDAAELLQAENDGTFEIAFGIFLLAVFVVVTVLHAMWIYRATWNSNVIRPLAGRISPGWAVGWYFVPVADLWMPFIAMRQTWTTSLQSAAQWGLLAGWWALWVLGSIAFWGVIVLAVLTELTPGTEVIGLLTLVDVFGVIISVLSSVLFIQIVRRITAAQSNHSPAAIFA